MEPIVLKNENLQAVFDPDRGMNLLSYKRGEIEVIDLSTRTLFEERYAGLGALIGPHFHHRHVIPPVKDEALFPHIARLKAKGVEEPFSHGIVRYAPWKAEATETKVTARLTGKDTWNGVALSALEGQNFTMEMTAQLSPDSLEIVLSVVSDADSLVGIHYYYHLPEGRGSVSSAVQSHYLENGQRKPLPDKWKLDSQHQLTLDLEEAYDVTFHPFPNPLEGKIVLDAVQYRLVTHYTCQSQENSWQLYHPAGASFVCIEPISSQDPHHPNLTVSSIKIRLHIEKL